MGMIDILFKVRVNNLLSLCHKSPIKESSSVITKLVKLKQERHPEVSEFLSCVSLH